MKRGLILLIILLIPSVLAYTPNVHLKLIDIKTHSQVDYVVVNVNLNNSLYTNNYVSHNDALNMFLPDGTYEAELKVEDLSTPGKDYYAKDRLVVETGLNKDIYLSPVGTINGVVEDLESNIVENAELKFECSDEIEKFPQKTDEFGFFAVKYVFEGLCKIFAKSKGYVGMVDVDVRRGSLNEVMIKLDKPSTENNFIITIIIITVIVIVILGILALLKLVSRRKGKLKKEIVEEKPKIIPSKRAEDVLKTLNNKEKSVVNYLLENKNQAYQANIRHGIGVPRTTLTRLLQSLENKNILKIEKHGKAVKVKLTEWFLGKE